ncbi:hypothetical protein C4577_07315 [Candidatus Parcubacteria bacterium]|nr:MAG: hypothetical protein C4577_07315 [Candidatus Parcubacteria bacterium]
MQISLLHRFIQFGFNFLIVGGIFLFAGKEAGLFLTLVLILTEFDVIRFKVDAVYEQNQTTKTGKSSITENNREEE